MQTSSHPAGLAAAVRTNPFLAPKLVRGGRVAAGWLAAGGFWFVEDRAHEALIIKAFRSDGRKVETLVDNDRMRAALCRDVDQEVFASGPIFDTVMAVDTTTVRFIRGTATYSYDYSSDAAAADPAPSPVEQMLQVDPASRTRPNMMRRMSVFPDPGEVPETLSPDARRFASLKNGDIYIRSVSDGKYDRLTDDAQDNDGWDVESTRFGVSGSGTLTFLTTQPWSPDSLKLYATRFDQRGVRPFYRIRYLRQFDSVEKAWCPRAGDELPVATPYVFDILSGRRVRLEVDAKDAFILLLGWTSDGGGVHLVRFSRDMKLAEVFVANAETGEARLLFSERSDTFVRIQHEVIGGRSGCTVLPGGLGFIWESDRSGWKHLYHYDAEGALVRQLTEGDWPVDAMLGYDAANGTVYFSARIDQGRPYDLHVAALPLAGGAMRQLTTEPGLHDAQFAPDFSSFVDTVQRADLPPQSRVRGIDGTIWHEFTPANHDALVAAGWTPPREVSVKAADGETDLHGLMYLPPDFDPGKKYPVIEYIYGGPQCSMVSRTFFGLIMSNMSSLNHLLPTLGYIVVVMDARGTPLRSKKFQDEVHGNWRHSVTADHATALRNLAREHPYLDLDRVGIWGHSWGGYYTFACMADAPDLYRAGVASAPGFDPYGSFIYEPWLGGVPGPATKAAYDDARLYPDAASLSGKLMIVAGMNDVHVWHSAVNMSHALIEAGVDHDWVPLPETHHGYGQTADRYMVHKLLGHFDRNVKGRA